ncbi:MAG: CHAP domain-containing protein [Pseudolysinimonas sp.]|uniref:CHAP domain-containing protein n=1 Tax=Pseudolysinimonas sp. TaxID=2680009 RepID=UPI003267F2BC
MTDSEFPDPMRGLFGEKDENVSRPDLARTSGVPENAGVPSSGWTLGDSPDLPVAAVPPADATFTSRRAMREAGGYQVAESAGSLPATAAPATTTPAPVTAAPVSRNTPTPAVSRTTSTAARSRPRGAAKRSNTRDNVRAGLKPPPTSLRRKLSTAGVMTVIFGLFATLALPAFADQGGPTQKNADPLAGQALDVTAANADAATSIRDTYGVTNASDLKKLYAEALRQQNLAAYLNSGAKELGDDYPYPDAISIDQGGGLSPFNYYYRECVDFVAWRMNRDAGVTSAPWKWVWTNLAQGSARYWKTAWLNHGWPTGTTPEVGAVAWLPGGNHVAYVNGILPDGTVLIEEYNWNRTHVYGQRIVPASSYYYLYAPPK